jgi:hypothetical protein
MRPSNPSNWSRRRVRSPAGRRSGLRAGALWGLMLLYGALLYWAASPAPDRAFVFVTLFVAFSYTVAGLWISTPLLLTGVIITVLALVGWLLFPAILGYWMAILGGGSMIVAGVLMIRAWE